MRNIRDYENNYIQPGFEDYQVKYRRKKVLEILRDYKPHRVLEIGCGMEPLFQYADWEYEAWTIVDPGEMFCDNAYRIVKHIENEKKISIYNEAFMASVVEKQNFDFVVCSGLLHEVEDSKLFLREIVDVCSEDTIVHINTPNANSFHRILAQGMRLVNDVHEFSQRNKQFQQHKVFDMELLKMEVKSAGFMVCDYGSYFIKPFTHDQMYKMMETNIIDENVLEGLYAISEIFKEYGSEIYINAKLAD